MNLCRKVTATIIGLCTLVLSIDAGVNHEHADAEQAEATPLVISGQVDLDDLSPVSSADPSHRRARARLWPTRARLWPS